MVKLLIGKLWPGSEMPEYSEFHSSMECVSGCLVSITLQRKERCAFLKKIVWQCFSVY